MCHATIALISPEGVPITLHVNEDDDTQSIIELLTRADKIGHYCSDRGWTFASDTSRTPDDNQPRQSPTFAGFPCSPTVDERGLPSWLIVDGKQAHRREKQGDVWYSVKLEDDVYEQVLRIPKGDHLPNPPST